MLLVLGTDGSAFLESACIALERSIIPVKVYGAGTSVLNLGVERWKR